jgi:acetyl-CoA acetyltransferase
MVEDVVTGCVTQAGEQGANIGRLAVMLAGFPVQVPATTLDRMCGSGQQAVHFAAQAIAAGDMHYAIGAGVENMTRVPMFSSLGGGFEVLNPDLLSKYELIHQGESAERLADIWDISRQAVDEFSAESHHRAPKRLTRAATANCCQQPVWIGRERQSPLPATRAFGMWSVWRRWLFCRPFSGRTVTGL